MSTRQQYGMTLSGVITDDVRKFLLQFRDNVKRGHAKHLHQSWTHFNVITEKTYTVSTWPSARDVIQDLQLDTTDEMTNIFIFLYQDLYFRHAFNRCDIDYNFMHDSFQNYINLFNALLDYADSGRQFPVIPNAKYIR